MFWRSASARCFGYGSVSGQPCGVDPAEGLRSSGSTLSVKMRPTPNRAAPLSIALDAERILAFARMLVSEYPRAAIEKSRRVNMSSLKSVLLVLLSVPSSAWCASEVERGRFLAEANCSGCHAIGRIDASRHPDALPFRRFSERYPKGSLAETLAKGVPLEHPDMPNFLATSSEIDEIVAYIISVQP